MSSAAPLLMASPPTMLPTRPNLVSLPLPPGAGAGFIRRAEELGVRARGAVSLGELVVDLDVYVVTLNGRRVDLSPRQVELLGLFLASPSRVWSRDQLHYVCWGDTSPSRRVDVQLCRIRGKLGWDVFRNIRDRGWAVQAA